MSRPIIMVVAVVVLAGIFACTKLDITVSQRRVVLSYNASSDESPPSPTCPLANESLSRSQRLIPTPTTTVELTPMPSTPAPTKKDGPHVAYCFTGSMRTMPLVWKNIFTNVIEALQPDPDLRTLFFRVDTSGHCQSNPVNVSDNQGSECLSQERTAEAEKQQLFESSEFRAAFPDANVMNSSQSCDEELFRAHPCCTNPNAGGFSDQYWGFSQYARKQHCIDDMRSYAKRTGVQFSYAVLVRPDLYFFEPVPPVGHLLNVHPRLLLPSKGQGASVGDYLFMFPWSLQTPVFDLLYDIFADRCRQPDVPDKEAAPEYMMETYLSRSSTLPHQIYPFSFVILRTGTKAECFRMKHQYLGKAKFVLDSQSAGHSQVLSIFDYCNKKFPDTSVDG